MDKGEMAEKVTGSITKLTNAAHYKTLAFCLVISLIVNCCQGYSNSKLTDRLIKTSEDLNEKRIEELKNIVQKEVVHQVGPIAKKVDTISQNADSTFKRINNRMK